MKKLLIAFTAVVATAAAAQANGGCPGPYCQSPPAAPQGSLFHRLFVKQPLPAFQAAPWYNYWPYNAHFMTPAPLPGMGSGYGPMVNPYFPAAGGYGAPAYGAPAYGYPR